MAHLIRPWIKSYAYLKNIGYVFTGEHNTPEYWTCDGVAGDYTERVYKHPVTGDIVTAVVSKEFGIFDVYRGDVRGQVHYS